jgi:hypothetical protein
VINRHTGYVVKQIGDNDQDDMVRNYENAINEAIKLAKGKKTQGRLVIDPPNYKLAGFGTVVKIIWLTSIDEKYFDESTPDGHKFYTHEVRPVPTESQLFYLLHARNGSSVTVPLHKPDCVDVDRELYQWRHKSSIRHSINLDPEWIPIGHSVKDPRNDCYKAIGVYDRMDNEQLGRMTSAAVKATTPIRYDED